MSGAHETKDKVTTILLFDKWLKLRHITVFCSIIAIAIAIAIIIATLTIHHPLLEQRIQGSKLCLRAIIKINNNLLLKAHIFVLTSHQSIIYYFLYFQRNRSIFWV